MGAYSPSLGKDYSSYVQVATDPSDLSGYRTKTVNDKAHKFEVNALHLGFCRNDNTGTQDASSQKVTLDHDIHGNPPSFDGSVFKKGIQQKGLDGNKYYEHEFFKTEDRLYFLSPGSNEYYFVGANRKNYGVYNIWPWGRGAIVITILNEGEFTKFSNFRNETKIKSNTLYGSVHAFETYGAFNNHGYYILPKQPNTTITTSDTIYQQFQNKGALNDGVNYSGEDANGYGESIEWFQTRSGIWDTVAIGMTTGGADDCGFFGLKNITCNTIIKIELLASAGADYRMRSGVKIGNGDWISNWSLPQFVDNEIMDNTNNKNWQTESNGYGNHGFILFHPVTGQYIINNTISPDSEKYDTYDPSRDFSIDNIPDDIVFYDSTSCPYTPPSDNGSKDILVYKDGGTSNTQGEIQPVIFYDKESN